MIKPQTYLRAKLGSNACDIFTLQDVSAFLCEYLKLKDCKNTDLVQVKNPRTKQHLIIDTNRALIICSLKNALPGVKIETSKK